MEQKLNITEILKNKALGTKLWSSLFGDVYFDSASANLVTVSHHKALAKFWCNAKLYDYDEAEPTLFPSKKMILIIQIGELTIGLMSSCSNF